MPSSREIELSGVIGTSSVITKLKERISLVAFFDVTVLLTGEVGNGSSYFARVIHENSPRAGNPFVEFCGSALPDDLVETELFGYVTGCFCGSSLGEGRVALAKGGALFLDRVDELSAPSRAKILDFLRTKQFVPVGADEPVAADVRVITGMTTHPGQAADDGLIAYLNDPTKVVSIRVPSVSDRREDIRDLVNHWCRSACERDGLPRIDFSDEALSAIESADWCPNLWYLSKFVERALIAAGKEGASRVDVRHFTGRPTPGTTS